MSYCKICGKKVPLFRKCGCTAAEKTEKKNSRALLVLIVFLVFFVLGLVLGIYLSGTGTKGTVKKYVKAASSKKGGQTFYSLTMPDDAIKALKAKDNYGDKVDDYNGMIKDMIDDLDGKETVPKFKKIMREKQLSKSSLRNAEKYFERLAEKYGAENADVKAVKGSEVRFRTVHRDEEGEYVYDKVTVCVVKLKGEGWKIIPSDAGGLDYYK